VTRNAINLKKANKKLRNDAISNVYKSYINGKIDYGSEIFTFSDREYSKLDVRFRIFLKNS
jgi:hypothetical protein